MRIIAVDDERLALEALVSSIIKAVPDAAVHGFRDPAEAMDFLRSHICDVAFLDIRMRGISGLELLAAYDTHISRYQMTSFLFYLCTYELNSRNEA